MARFSQLSICCRRRTPYTAAQPPPTDASSSGASPSGATAPTPPSDALPKRGSWEVREARAEAAGEAARSWIEGHPTAYPERLADLPANRVYVVLRDHAGHSFVPALLCSSWGDARQSVESSRGVLGPLSTFHGFASRREAAAYCRGARVELQ